MRPMRLEVGSIHVRDVEIGRATALSGHTLVIDPEELRALVLEDSHFADVRVHLVKPGESVRVIHVLDVVEPRWKVSGPGGVFPGFVSPALTVGEGRTHRLAGVAVAEVGAPVPGESTVFRQRLIDMAGPGAELTPFARTMNVALEFTPNMACFPPGSEQIKDFLTGGPESHEYNRAVLHAGLEVAAKHGARNIRVFGSFARGEATERSDLDLLVDVGTDCSPFFPGGLIAELESSLGLKVDVVTEPALHWFIRDRVIEEAVPL